MTEAMCPAAAALVSTRYAHARGLYPLLPEDMDDLEVATAFMVEQHSFCEGVAVLDDRDELEGFLLALERSPDPSSSMARYAPERSAVHLVHAHAIAPGANATRLYAALWGALAPRFVERGIIEFATHIPLGFPEIERAWTALGFGRFDVVAARDLSPIDRKGIATVRQATPDDLDSVDRLVDEEAVFHARSPIFRPYVRAQTEAAVRVELSDQLASSDHAFFIGSVDGRDVGIVSVTPGFGYVRRGACYIGATAVLPEIRGSGVGAAVVASGLEWAAAKGYRLASLHFASSNMTSTSFWTGLGFEPVMVHMRRRLDDRIVRSGAVPSPR